MKTKSEQLNMCNANASLGAKKITLIIQWAYSSSALFIYVESCNDYNSYFIYKKIYIGIEYSKNMNDILAMECQHIQATNSEI